VLVLLGCCHECHFLALLCWHLLLLLLLVGALIDMLQPHSL
jgi:hypothetical protein